MESPKFEALSYTVDIKKKKDGKEIDTQSPNYKNKNGLKTVCIQCA